MKRGFPTLGSGFRSQLEEKIAADLEKNKVAFQYENHVLPYVKPASNHKYSVDFILPNGILIEAKGLLDLEDRKKHLLIKAQYPDLDIRFVLSSSRTKISSGSKTTIGEWMERNGYIFAEKLVPKAWLKEPNRPFPKGVFTIKESKE